MEFQNFTFLLCSFQFLLLPNCVMTLLVFSHQWPQRIWSNIPSAVNKLMFFVLSTCYPIILRGFGRRILFSFESFSINLLKLFKVLSTYFFSFLHLGPLIKLVLLVELTVRGLKNKFRNVCLLCQEKRQLDLIFNLNKHLSSFSSTMILSYLNKTMSHGFGENRHGCC